MKPEGFNFELTDINSGKTYGATSGKNGIVKLCLTFMEDDIGRLFGYTLEEANDGIEGVVCSGEVYKIEAEVTFGEDSRLVAEIAANDESTDKSNS